MISYLKGIVVEKDAKNAITLDVHDVGYKIIVNNNLLCSLSIGDEIALFIHSHIREDEFSLFGFLTQDEVSFFKMLTSVSGIGPKTAMEIMNSPVLEVKKAILEQKTNWLTRIPGLGKKTAGRLILELKDKIKDINLDDIVLMSEANISEDVVTALMNLGYQRYHIRRVLGKAPNDLISEEELIRFFLQNM